MFVKDKVIIGAQGGEWPYRGPIFAVDARTGQEVWKFYTVGGNDGTHSDARNTWGNDSWRTGGGGGWMPGNYDPDTNTVWWGTGNPAPLYDWSGPDFMSSGARPGTNLYTSSVIGLDPDSGELKAYHQELPHDAWDFDSAVGEFVMIERAGKKYIVHPNKSGFVFVYDRKGNVQNVWRVVKNINFVQDIKPDGTLVGRRDLTEGAHKDLCPFIAGGVSWNAGTYNPKTGLYYKVGNEWCMDLTVTKTTPILEPMAQLNIGANFSLVNPPGEKAHGHVAAHDPLTGAKKWEVRLPRAAPGQPAVHCRQPAVRPRRARLSACFRCDRGQGVVEAQQRPGPQRRHHQLQGQGRQAVRRRGHRLGRAGGRRLRKLLRQALQHLRERLGCPGSIQPAVIQTASRAFRKRRTRQSPVGLPVGPSQASVGAGVLRSAARVPGVGGGRRMTALFLQKKLRCRAKPQELPASLQDKGIRPGFARVPFPSNLSDMTRT